MSMKVKREIFGMGSPTYSRDVRQFHDVTKLCEPSREPSQKDVPVPDILVNAPRVPKSRLDQYITPLKKEMGQMF